MIEPFVQELSRIGPQASSPSVPYAVVVKTYVWNTFVARQVRRIAERVGSGDVWVIADESRSPLQVVTHPRTLRVTEADAGRLGLAHAKTGKSLFWYCGDYLHYLFREAYPHYGYYIFVEHDVIARIDLDTFVASISQDEIDYVGSAMQATAEKDPWFAEHLSVYPAEDLKRDLYCFAAFSARALRRLQSRRTAMSRDFDRATLAFWPIGEVFVPTEIARAGLRRRELKDYGDTSLYDWWPPLHENDLVGLPEQSFAHPVLEGISYLQSALRHASVPELMRPGSPARARVLRYGASTYMPHLMRELRRRTIESIRRRLERIGLLPHWTAGIAARTAGPPRTAR